MGKHLLLKSITAEQLAEIEIGDWLEGYGDILSSAQADYIQRYGKLLIQLLKTMKLYAGDCCSLNNEVDMFRGRWEEAEEKVEELEIKNKRLRDFAEWMLRHITDTCNMGYVIKNTDPQTIKLKAEQALKEEGKQKS